MRRRIVRIELLLRQARAGMGGVEESQRLSGEGELMRSRSSECDDSVTGSLDVMGGGRTGQRKHAYFAVVMEINIDISTGGVGVFNW